MVNFSRAKQEAGKFFSETGEKIIGRGPEVTLRHNVKEYADNNGVSAEQAQKVIFQHYLADLQGSLNKGILDIKDKDWRKIEAFYNEVFGKEGKENFETLAETPGVYINSGLAAPSDKEKKAWGAHFESRYGAKPKDLELTDTTQTFRLVKFLSMRLSALTTASIGDPRNLEDLIAADARFGADLGKLLQAREVLVNREKCFKTECHHKESVDNLKASAKKDLGDFFLMNGVNALKEISKGKFNPLSIAGRLMVSLPKFVGKEMLSLGKFGYHATETIARGTHKAIQKKVRKTHIAP
ncbi:MAG: hypothetical protein NTZ42_04565 [Candidatus Gribaldobacteria bacterium]|nr:hypothetical protein [Candidatus Gribaldobacteria bacterium]